MDFIWRENSNKDGGKLNCLENFKSTFDREKGLQRKQKVVRGTPWAPERAALGFILIFKRLEAGASGGHRLRDFGGKIAF